MGTMSHADRGTMGYLIISPWSLLLVCLLKNLVEILIKSIDIPISDLFVKYQRHHGKTTELQGEAPLGPKRPIYIWCGYSFVILYIIQNTLLLLVMDSHDIHYTYYVIEGIYMYLTETNYDLLISSPPSPFELQSQTSAMHLSYSL